MIRMDEINQIRKSFFSKGQNKNQIAKKYRRAWGTVNNIVSMTREELEKRGKRPTRNKHIMTPEVILAIENYFDIEKTHKVKKKQKYTAKQIFQELTAKGLYKGKIRRMQEMVSILRKKHGQTKTEAFLPLDFPMGSALQIDHGECEVQVEEERYKSYLFVASVPGQVLRYCQIFPVKTSEAWGEFHERAFHFFGGIFNRVIYDNDKVLVKKVIGSERKQTNFSINLEEHYGFESHFCNVGAGNEKGAVENGVGYCRRRFLAGLPAFTNWESANNFLSDCCLKDIKQGIHYKTKDKLFPLFQQIKNKISPLPLKKEWSRWIDCRVDKYQLITIDHHNYSVPERFIGSYLRIALTIFKIEIMSGEDIIAEYQRQYGRKDTLTLDHYLDQLKRKPFALPYAKAVTRNNFDPILVKIWDRLSEKYGGKEANRQFVSILLLRRQWSQKELLEGVEQALNFGAIDSEAVETILRQKQLPTNHYNIEELKSLIPTSAVNWDFNLGSYAQLCEEAVL